MKINTLTLFLLALPMWLGAQGTRAVEYGLARPDSVWGVTAVVVEKGRVGELLSRLDDSDPGRKIKGYRVCIFMGNNQNARTQAFEAEAKFKAAHSDVPTYVVYDRTSYWKVYAGNCLTVDELTMLKEKAERLFPSKPFIVQEEIPISEFGKRVAATTALVGEETSAISELKVEN